MSASAVEPKEHRMLSAIVLITVERGRTADVAEQLAAVPGVSEAYSVAGRYDLVAMLRVRTAEEMETLVTRDVAAVEGIVHTETLTAFRAYSRYELEHLFDLGAEA